MSGRIAILLACILGLALPITAAGQEKSGKEPKGKDLCLLYSEECPRYQETLQEKIRHIQREIDRGADIYTPDELLRLRRKLKEAEDLLYYIEFSPSSK